MSFQLQQQIKQNSEDIKNYVQDLYDWEQSMETKTNKKQKTAKETEKVSAPIRGNVDIQISREDEDISNNNKKENESQQSQKNPKLVRDANTVSDYYKAWDKYNPDKELENIEQEENRENQKKLDKFNPYLQNQDKQKAPPRSKIEIRGGRGPLNIINSLRDKGNLYFKSTEYQLAIDQYTECINIFKEQNEITRDEQELKMTILSNRAMAYIKIQEYSLAEQDCNTALKINPKNGKALYRRGVSRRKMQKYKQSLEDFQMAAKIDPKNSEIQKELVLVQQKYNKIKEDANNKLIKMTKEESYKQKVPVQDIEQNIFEQDSYIDELEEKQGGLQINANIQSSDSQSNATYEEDSMGSEGKLDSNEEYDDAEVAITPFGKLKNECDKFPRPSLKSSDNKPGEFFKNDDQFEDIDENEESQLPRGRQSFSGLKKIDVYHSHSRQSQPDAQQIMSHDVFFRNENEIIPSGQPHQPHYDPDEVPKKSIVKGNHNNFIHINDIDGKVVTHQPKKSLLEGTASTIGKDNDIKFGGEAILENGEEHTYKKDRKPRRSILNPKSLENYNHILDEQEEAKVDEETAQVFQNLKNVEGKVIKHDQNQSDSELSSEQEEPAEMDNEKEEEKEGHHFHRQRSVSFVEENKIIFKDGTEEGDEAHQYSKSKTPRKSILRNDISDNLTFLQSEENFNSEKLKNIEGKVIRHSMEEIDMENESPIKNRKRSIKFSQSPDNEEYHSYNNKLKPRGSILKQYSGEATPVYLRQKSSTESPCKQKEDILSEDSESGSGSESDYEDEKHVQFIPPKPIDIHSSPLSKSRNSLLQSQGSTQRVKSILKHSDSFEKQRSHSVQITISGAVQQNSDESKMNDLLDIIKEEQDSKQRQSQTLEQNELQQQQLQHENQQQEQQLDEQSQAQKDQQSKQDNSTQNKNIVYNNNIKTSIQFTQMWANLKKNMQKQFEFLQNELDPILLKDVFKSGMDVSLIQDIFNALKQNYDQNPQLAKDYIENVPKVKRFEINRMSMISKEKQSISDILIKLKNDSLISEEDQKKYLKLYQI